MYTSHFLLCSTSKLFCKTPDQKVGKQESLMKQPQVYNMNFEKALKNPSLANAAFKIIIPYTSKIFQINHEINHIDKPDKLHLAATTNRELGHEALLSLIVQSLASSGYRQIARTGCSWADKMQNYPISHALLHQSQPASKHNQFKHPYTMGLLSLSLFLKAGEIMLLWNNAFVSKATTVNCC